MRGSGKLLENRVEMVSCSDFIRDYSDYRDGLLPECELAATQAHLDICSSCQSYVRVVDAGIGELLSISPIEPSDDFLGRLQHRLYHLDSEKGFIRRDGSGASLAFVMLLLAVIGLASWFPVFREAANTVELAPVHASAPAEHSQALTLFTPGPLLLRNGSPERLVATDRESDLFTGYALGTYVVNRRASLSR